MPNVPSSTVEIEFTAGVWTDVTADVDDTLTIVHGRTSEFSAPQVGTCTFNLDNRLGKYSPLTQVLSDGTVHPYYPNVIPRKRVRVTLTQAGSVRFFGYIKSWPPLLINGIRGVVQVTAVDRMGLLAQITATQCCAVQSMLSDAPTYLVPFQEPSGAVLGQTTFAEIVSGQYTVYQTHFDTASSAITSGVATPIPYPEGTTGVQPVGYGPVLELLSGSSRSPNGNADPASLIASFLPPAGNTTWTVEAWITVPSTIAASGDYSIWTVDQPAGNTSIQVGWSQTSGQFWQAYAIYYDSLNLGGLNPLGVNRPVDGLPHLFTFTGVDNGTNLVVTGYLDGVSFGQVTGVKAGGTLGSTTLRHRLFWQANKTKPTTHQLGPVAVYPSTLTSTRALAHYTAGLGLAGWATGWQVGEYMKWAGVASTEYTSTTVADGKIICGPHPVVGKSIIDLCQECAVTEGGGAAFSYSSDGNATFTDNTFRKATTPTFIIDAVLDLDALSSYAPAYDDLKLVTRSTVSRPDQTGVGFTALSDPAVPQTFIDTAPEALYGISSDTASSVCARNADALRLAQDRVRGASTPGFRLTPIVVDLRSAVTTNMMYGINSVQIGARLRVTGLPQGHAPATQLDVVVEGWTETWTPDSYRLSFDTSPVDNPARWLWGNTTYGRWQPSAGSMTLSATITAAATSLVVVTAAGAKPFTVVAGAYPTNIVIGQEIITLTAAPGSSTSPQTFTVTRGINGTFAAAQTAGAAITLSPGAAWAL